MVGSASDKREVLLECSQVLLDELGVSGAVSVKAIVVGLFGGDE